MNRKEHLEWYKKRALEYVAIGDEKNALTSMFSDLRKHPETANHTEIELGMMLIMTKDMGDVRKFINGFN